MFYLKRTVFILIILIFTSLQCVKNNDKFNSFFNNFNAFIRNSYAYITTSAPKGEIISDIRLHPLYFKPLSGKKPHTHSTLQLINQIHDDYEGIPTVLLSINNHSWQISPEIQNAETVILHAPGRPFRMQPPRSKEELARQTWGGGPQRGCGALSLITALKKEILPSTLPCVTFDFPCYRKEFDHAQDLQRTLLEYMVNKLDADQIIINSVCIGSTVILRMLAESDQELLTPIKAAILQSPPISLKDISEQLARTYVSWIPYSGSMIYGLFKALHPNVDSCKDMVISTLEESSPPSIPLLIAHIKGDNWVSDESIFNLVKTLKLKNKNIYLLVIEKDPNNLIRHGTLHKSETFGSAIHAFLRKHNLPHDVAKADKGTETLERASKNIQANAIEEWNISPLQ